MAKDIIKNIPLTLDINARKRLNGTVDISLYSKDIATGQFEFTFIDEDGDPVTLDETYSAQALVKYEGNSKTYLDNMTIEGNIIRFIFPHDFITKDGTITMYIYITKDNYTSDVAAISFPVFVSEIDKDLDPSISVHYIGKIEQLIEDMKNNIKEKEQELLNEILSNTTVNNIDEYYQQYNDVITELSEEKDYHSLPEIAAARRGYSTLVESLNNLSINMFNPNLGKLTQIHMSDELLAQMAGDTAVNAVPMDGSLTTEKLADKAITPDKTSFVYVDQRNLADPEKFTENIRFATNGSEVDSDLHIATDFIPVEQGAYIIAMPDILDNTPKMGRVPFYGQDKNFVSIVSDGMSASTNSTTVDIPSDGYIRVSVNKEFIHNLVVVNNNNYDGYHDFMYRTDVRSQPPASSVGRDELMDESVSIDKTDFIDYTILSSNYFNKENAILDTFLNNAGHVPMETYFVSGMIQSPETSSWAIYPCRYVNVYDANKVSLSSENTGSNSATKVIEVPAGGWFEFAGPMSLLDNAQLNKGTELEPFEEYKDPIVSFPELSLTETQGNELISTLKFGYDQLDFMKMTSPSNNYFDKSTAKIDVFMSTSSYNDFADYFTSQLITSEDESSWTIHPCRAVRVFDSSGNRIHFNNSGSNYGTQTIDVPAGGSFEFSGHMTVIDTTQVNKGDTVLGYEPFRIPAPTFPELEFTQEQKVELLGNAPIPTVETGRLEVTRDGTELQVRSESDGHVLINNLSLNSSANGAFRILSTALDNRTIHSVTDDITPIRTFYTVGANHGYPSQKVTISGHDKEIADLGSVWTDGEADFTLLRVDGDVLTFISEYVVLSDGTHTYKSGFSGSTLTHKSGATNTSQLTSVSPSGAQLYPSIKDIHQELNIPSDDGKYNVDELIIRESYEILDYMALVDWCQSNIGKHYEDNLEEIEAMAKYSTTYTYRNFGKCLVNNSLLYYKKSIANNTGFLQSGRLNLSATRYMPDIKPIGDVDFKQGVSIDAITSNLIVRDSDLIDVEYPPTRYVDSHENYGYTMGFVPDKLGGMSSERKANTDQYWDLRNTGKSYPVAFNGLVGIAEPGDYYAIEGYRNYFIQDPDLTLFDEVEDGEAYYVFIDAHKSIPYLTRNVSAKEGSKIEVIRQDGIELVNDYVSSEGITFKVPGEYGQMVLKIYK